MAFSNHSINYSAILSGTAADVSVGMAVLNTTTGFVPATSANRTLYSARAYGIALTAGEAYRAIQVAHGGVIDSTISGLGTGTAGDYVIVSATGTLTRTASPAGSDDIIGRCPSTKGDVVVTPCASVGGGGGSTPTGSGFRRVVAGVEDAAASAVNLAGGATHVTGTLPADQGGAMSRVTLTFADLNQTIAAGDAAFDSAIIKLAGSNATAARDLIMPLPASAAASYVRVIEMSMTGSFGVRLTMGAGPGTWTIPAASGGALHIALFTPDGVTVWGPAGTPANLGVQYLQSNGYLGAVNIGTAGQVLKVNGTATGYEFGAAAGGSSFSDSAFEITDDVDATKKLKFQCSGIATATTRTLTAPNADDTMAVLGLAQTLAAKTLTGVPFISFSGTVPAAGEMRFPYSASAGPSFQGLNSAANTVHLMLWQGNYLYLGTDASFASQVSNARLFASAGGDIGLGLGGNTYLYLNASLIQSAYPRVGFNAPYASEGYVAVPVAASLTLTAAQYSRRFNEFTGTPAAFTATYPNPSSEDQAYEKWITNSTGVTATIAAGTGTATIATGATKCVRFRPNLVTILN